MNQEDLQRGLGRVEGKLDLMIDLLNKKENTDAALETRLRKVEQKLYWFTGASFAAGLVLSKIDFTKVISIAHAAV